MAQDEVDFAAVWNNALNTVADTDVRASRTPSCAWPAWSA